MPRDSRNVCASTTPSNATPLRHREQHFTNNTRLDTHNTWLYALHCFATGDGQRGAKNLKCRSRATSTARRTTRHCRTWRCSRRPATRRRRVARSPRMRSKSRGALFLVLFFVCVFVRLRCGPNVPKWQIGPSHARVVVQRLDIPLRGKAWNTPVAISRRPYALPSCDLSPAFSRPCDASRKRSLARDDFVFYGV